jgi:hypothetical protein
MRLVGAFWVVLVALVLGVVVGTSFSGSSIWRPALLSGLFSSSNVIYEADISPERQHLVYNPLAWDDLLPREEAAALQGAKVDEAAPLHQQIFRSIQSSFDTRYQDAMKSSNTVAIWNNKNVSIHGFIVPLDINNRKQIVSFFIVPYFGACIHYPPPPPNQIIYAHVSEGLSNIDINNAYRFTGRLNQGLFEDPQGTSAYLLEVDKIMSYDSGLKSEEDSKRRREPSRTRFHLDTPDS